MTSYSASYVLATIKLLGRAGAERFFRTAAQIEVVESKTTTDEKRQWKNDY